MTPSLSAAWIAVALSLLPAAPAGQAQPAPRFKAVAFDYFVIFDANSIVTEVEKTFPGKSAEFVRIWRAKQFEYCYLRTITGRFANFSAVTEEALVRIINIARQHLGRTHEQELPDPLLH